LVLFGSEVVLDVAWRTAISVVAIPVCGVVSDIDDEDYCGYDAYYD